MKLIENYNKIILEIKIISEKGFFHLFTLNSFILIIGFASQLFVAGMLSPADIGRIKILQTFIGMASLIGGFGFNTSLLKLVSDEKYVYEREKLLNFTLLMAFLSFILIYCGLLLLASFGLISNDPVLLKIFPLYTFFLLPLIWQSIQIAYYQALKKIKKMVYIQLWIKFVSVGLIIAATYYYGLEGYVIIIAITGLIAIIALGSGLPFRFNKKILLIPEINTIKLLWSLAKFAFLANIVGTLLATLDVYFINYLITNKTEIGYYMFALTVVSLYQIIPASIQQVSFPYFSSKSENYINWKQSYDKYNKLNHIILAIIIICGIITIPKTFSFAFHGKNDRSIIYFMLLSISFFFNSANMMKGTALMGFGKFNLNFYASLICLIISIPIMYLLIYEYELKGAIIGKILVGIISYLVSHLIFRSFIKQKI
jgi:O-antigen/teichoic acid export membrane protein